MRWNITIVTSSDSLIVILVTSLKLENELKKHVQNVAKIKYRFGELVVILFTLIFFSMEHVINTLFRRILKKYTVGK